MTTTATSSRGRPRSHAEHLAVLARARGLAMELLYVVNEARELPDGPVPALKGCGGWQEAMADLDRLAKGAVRFVVLFDTRAPARLLARLDRIEAEDMGPRHQDEGSEP